MDKTKLEEMLSAGKWADFLNALPFGRTDWNVSGQKALMNLRVTAVRIAKKGERSFSIEASTMDELKVYIAVGKPKNKQNATD